MIQRQFFSIIFWLILVNLVVKAIFIFGIDLQVQKEVGPSDYGLYFMLLNLCYIFQIINDFGLNLLHTTDTARHNRIRIERWRQILRIKLMLALWYSGAVILIALILGYGDSWKWLIWLIVNNILVSLILVFRSGISGMGRYKTEAWISVMDKALMIVFCGLLLLLPLGFKMEWFIWAQSLSLVITVFTAAWLSRNLIDRSETSITSEPLLLVFKDTLPFTMTTLLMFIYTRSDSILIGKLMANGAHHAGVYAAGYRLLDAANMMAYLFSPLLLPMFARMHQNREETLQLTRVSGGLMVLMVFSIGFAGFWWAADIMPFLYGNITDDWITTFRLLILSHIPIGLMYVFGTYLTALQQLKQMNRWFLLSVLISIGLNLWLIPKWGTVGAASTAVIVQTLTTGGLIYFWKVHLNVKLNWTVIARVMVCTVLMGTVGWGLASLSLYWLLELLLFMLFCVGCAFGFRLIQWDLIRDVLKRRGEMQVDENSPGNSV